MNLDTDSVFVVDPTDSLGYLEPYVDHLGSKLHGKRPQFEVGLRAVLWFRARQMVVMLMKMWYTNRP